jgi:predicted dehydrogenase
MSPRGGSAAGEAGDARPENRDAYGAPRAGSAAGEAGDARPENRDACGAPRAAIVGTGYVARVHAHALRELGVRIVAVCGRSTTAVLARDLGAAAYDDLADLLEAERPDALHVCTPNAAHAEQALLALERGVHVVCEKPLAVSSAEAERLVDAAAASGLVAACCYHCRGYPLVERIRAEVEAGTVGTVRAVHGRYACDDLFQMPTGWRYDPTAAGPSYVVGDLGTHWLDLAEHVTGLRVAEVFAEFVGEPLEHWASLLLRLEGGAVGSVVLFAGAAGRKNQLLFELEGSSGGLSWDQEKPNTLFLRHATEPTRIVPKAAGPLARYPAGHAEGYGDAFRNVFDNVYRAILGEPHEPYPTFADGARGVATLEAVVRSAGDGRWAPVG